MSLLTLLGVRFGVLRARAGVGDYRDVGCGHTPGQLDLLLPDGSRIREACAAGSYVGGATAAAHDSAPTVAIPPVAAGDLLVAALTSFNQGDPVAAPAGWTEREVATAIVQIQFNVWTRIADGSEMSVGAVLDADMDWAMLVRAYRHVTLGDTTSSMSGPASTYDDPVSSGSGSAMVLHLYGGRGTFGNNPIITPPALSNTQVAWNQLSAVAAADETVTLTGSTTARTATSNGNVTSSWAAASVVLPGVFATAHPLRIEDPANPGTWIDVACMVPA